MKSSPQEKTTLVSTLEAFRARTRTPSDTASEMLAFIKDENDALHAYLRVFDTDVRAAAARADAAYGAGTARPLEGALIAVKDNLLVTGTETTAASKILEGYMAPYTATAVARLEAAGAIVLGKTNMDEFAMGSSTENSAYGPTEHPTDGRRVPGGSSGGSAAAVVAGLCHAALGSDTGGSIRQPAALSGCVGFKPSYGAVSRYGLIAMASSLDVVGPLTNSVADARLIFDVMRGRDDRDGTSVDIEIQDSKFKIQDSLKGVRVGIPQEYFLPGIDSGVEGAVQMALKRLEMLGATLVPISLPHSEYGLATYYVIMPAEASTNLSRFDGVRFPSSRMTDAGSLEEGYRNTRALFGPEVKRRILIGTYVLSAGYYDAYYRQAQKARALLIRDFDQAWSTVDVIAAPVSPTPAWQMGEKTDDPLSMYLSDIFTVTANLVGVPSISVPCGESDLLPVGLQLMAARGKDQYLLDVAEVFEKS